jgi:hypothetical protein
VSEITASYTDYFKESKGTRIATFFCPEFYQRPKLSCWCHWLRNSVWALTIFLLVADWVTSDIRITSPDLLLSIDYNKLSINANQLSVRQSAFVFMGFTNDTTLVTRTSYALPVMSRTHSLATVHYKGRQIIETNGVSLGIFPVRICRFVQLTALTMVGCYIVIQNVSLRRSQLVNDVAPVDLY